MLQKLRRFLLVAVPLTLIFATAMPAIASAAPKGKGPKSVKPGKKMKLQVTGFAKGARVQVILQPTANRGGNGMGIAVKKKFKLSKRGKGSIRFRMPKRYLSCAGAANCVSRKWKRKSKVDINVCSVTLTRQVPTCAMAVARIR